MKPGVARGRRDFLKSAGALAVAPLALAEADLVLHGGHVVTMDGAQPRAQAVAIFRDRFLAVGNDADVLHLARARTKRVNLGGRTVVPGFIDGHSHPASAGVSHLRRVDCDLRSIDEIVTSLQERAGRTPAGEWVLGFKYDDTKTREGRRLTRADLDAVVSHPVLVEHRGGHSVYANSRAFETAGLSESTPDPPGGRFDRDPATGRLSGRAAETAAELLNEKVPSAVTRDDWREGIKTISRMMARAGLTSSTDAGGSPETLLGYQDARDSGELLLRIYCSLSAAHLDRAIEAGIKTGLGDSWVRVGFVKHVCDGSISERTARLVEPYVGRPDDRGILVTTEEELYARTRKAHAAGFQVGTHANGDEGIDVTLRVYERLQRELPKKDPRFRIEHCTVVNDDLVARIKALGVIPTPFSTYVYYHGEKMREYGEERLRRMFALRSFLDAGVPATQASDYPPGPFEPMMALQSEVTRTDVKGTVWGARQRISVDEAIRVGTVNGAYASFEEHEKGRIAAGYLADLVVLGRDPYKEDPSTLVTIPIERTMVGGRWVYES